VSEPVLPAAEPRRAWWPPSLKTVVWVFLYTALVVGVVQTAVWRFLDGEDRRVVVVTLAQGHDSERRQEMRAECGRLPAVELVEDRGRPEQAIRFPARFAIAGATPQQEEALQQCIRQYTDIVVGTSVEGRA
jgi:hypothetical protein